MNLRMLSVAMLICVFAGCDGSAKPSITSSEVKFRNYEAGTLTFDVRVRKGDSVCWEHGEDGTIARSLWKADCITTLTISSSEDRLKITCDGGMCEDISVESVTLFENPKLTNGKYHVGNYVQKRGAARMPETPLYVYVEDRDRPPAR